MASRYSIKTKDTGPPLEATLEDKNGPINLTNATSVIFLMRLEKSEGGAIEKTCSIISAAKGEVRVKWLEADTAVAGTYECEWKIHWNTGEVDSVPNEGYETLVIRTTV